MTAIRKLRLYQILLIILAITLSNCMSDDYNLKNGVNTDITLGGDSLSFPLGKTNPIFLSSILKDTTGVLKTLADGSYSLQLKDSSQISVKGVNPVTFSIIPPVIPSISSNYLGVVPPSGIKRETLINYSSQFISLAKQSKMDRLVSLKNKAINNLNATIDTLYYNIPAQSFNININQFVSNDVKKIYDLTLKQASHLTFQIAINNLNPIVDSLFFDNYKIQLPTYLKFNDPDVNSNNVLTINSGFPVRTGYTKILSFEVLDFNSQGGISLLNGQFSENSESTMQKGLAYIKAKNFTPSDINVFEVQPSIGIEDMSVSLIDGVITPTIDPISKNIAINLPDVLKQTGNVLDIQNPVITLQVGNSMAYSANAALTMIPKGDDGLPIPNGTVSTQFTIPATDLSGQLTWTNYWMSKSNTGIPASPAYQWVDVPNLPNLLRIAPNGIEIDVIPTINIQHLDLNSQNNQLLNIKYSVNVPLDFGQDFKILYLDTISNLKKNLEQIVKLSKQVELIAFIDNQIPLDLNFEIIPLDISKQIISGISVSTPQTIKSCNTDGTSQRSTLNLIIKETTPGTLTQLDALQIKVSASKNSAIALANIPLKSTQSVTVELRAKVPNGITITKN